MSGITSMTAPTTAILLSIIGSFLVYAIYRISCIGMREEGLPPGPPTVPIFGNMLQIPITQIEQQLTEWHKQYGPIISLKLGTSTLIVLADREAIRDLWEKRSGNYSDRWESYVAGLLTNQHHAAFQSMGDSWRDRRKLISHYYSPQQCDNNHKAYQEAEATAFLKSMVDTPLRFIENTKRFAAAITGALTYGRRPKEYGDQLCQDVIAAMGYIAENMELGATPPVDEFPFRWMQKLPSHWAHWKARAIDHGHRLDELFDGLWSEMIKRRNQGIIRNSLFDQFLDKESTKGNLLGSWRWGLHSLQFLGGEILEGGADTTSSTMISFMMAMACYPEIQRRAQKQIDKAVGDDRLPNWSDYDDIPYVAQIQKETIRWRPVTVLGAPHVAQKADTYKGFVIPKGARTIQCTWALHMDPNFYPNPDEFWPERFEGRTKLADHYQGTPDWKNRDHYGYGGGRRICPGMHIAERSLWRAISKMLWAFDIQPITDPMTGKPAPPNTSPFNDEEIKSAFAGGAVRVAHPFKIKITPRSAKHAAVIDEEYAKVLPLLQSYE